MLQDNNQQQNHFTQNMPANEQFGGHELFDADEAIGCLVGAIEHYVIYHQHVQDQQLLTIMQKQQQALTGIYNTIVETMRSGTPPTQKTQDYLIQENMQVTFGLQPSQPKTPIQSVNELTDECISSGVLGHLKAIGSEFTLAAFEATNPILRRIFADSIPNVIEMGYEMFIYQNKHKYYQVPQLQKQHMQIITNSYAPTQQTMQ